MAALLIILALIFTVQVIAAFTAGAIRDRCDMDQWYWNMLFVAFSIPVLPVLIGVSLWQDVVQFWWRR